MFTLWICLLLTPVNTCSTWYVEHFANVTQCQEGQSVAIQNNVFSFCAPKWEEI